MCLPLYVLREQLSGAEAMSVFFFLPPVYLGIGYAMTALWVWIFDRIAPWADGVPLRFAEEAKARVGVEGS
ncbi:MAG: hypothetical protein ACE5HQ_13520 [Gemmatimonadota bacterium]